AEARAGLLLQRVLEQILGAFARDAQLHAVRRAVLREGEAASRFGGDLEILLRRRGRIEDAARDAARLEAQVPAAKARRNEREARALLERGHRIEQRSGVELRLAMQLPVLQRPQIERVVIGHEAAQEAEAALIAAGKAQAYGDLVMLDAQQIAARRDGVVGAGRAIDIGRGPPARRARRI